MEQKLRNEARALLEQGKVDCILGFEPGSLKFTTTPLITKDKSDVDRLVINPFIVNNLSKFLIDLPGRTAIVAKGCDSRSIVSLVQDHKVNRDKVVIIGVPCSGNIDLRKVERLVGRDRNDIDDIKREGDKVIITVTGEKKSFPITEVLFDSCLGCESPVPKEHDILLGETSDLVTDKAASLKKIEELKAMTPEQRWEFWKQEFSRCIRCYACRNVCPACFCDRCFVEESEPRWVSPVPQWQDNLMFQIVRNIHVAGRCTDCGGCERVCPANIPLRAMAKEMSDLVEELFHCKSGTDKNAPPLFACYEMNEAEDIFR